jgi:hypothetical protein
MTTEFVFRDEFDFNRYEVLADDLVLRHKVEDIYKIMKCSECIRAQKYITSIVHYDINYSIEYIRS